MKQTKKRKSVESEPIVKHWCPTQCGTFTAYAPEYFDGAEWKLVRLEICGIPYPLMFQGIIKQIGLYGYEQAQAIAWIFAALSVSSQDLKKTEVRVQAYEVIYDIKAAKISESPDKGA